MRRIDKVMRNVLRALIVDSREWMYIDIENVESLSLDSIDVLS